MQKLERLLNLTAVLLHTGRPLTAADLRERVPGYPEGDTAFRRSFERDKDDLRDLGIPIDLVPIPGTDPPAEGYRIPRSAYYLPKLDLDPDELAALQLASAAVRLDGTAGAEALWKLGGETPTGRELALSASLPADPSLAPLFEALSARAEVGFDYRDENRRVRPYRLGFQLGNWYLRAFDLDRQAIRVFRVDRITSEVEVGRPGTYEIPSDERDASDEIIPDRWELGEDPALRARLVVDASHAPLALTQFDPEHVTAHHDDGSVEVTITVTNRAAFRSLVLSYLHHAEVLDPPELRREVVEWLRPLAGPPAGEVPE